MAAVGGGAVTVAVAEAAAAAAAAAAVEAPRLAADFVWTSAACTAEPIQRSCWTSLLHPCSQIPSVPWVEGCPPVEIPRASSVRSSSAPASNSPAGSSPLLVCVGLPRSLLGASSALIHPDRSTVKERSAGHPTGRSPAVLGLTAAGAGRGPCGRRGRTFPWMTEAASLDGACSSCQTSFRKQRTGCWTTWGVKGNMRMDRVGWMDKHVGWRTPGSAKTSV